MRRSPAYTRALLSVRGSVIRHQVINKIWLSYVQRDNVHIAGARLLQGDVIGKN